MGSAVYSAKSAAAQAAAVTVPPLTNNVAAPDPKKAGIVENLPSGAIYAQDAETIRANFHALTAHIQKLQAALKAAGITL